MAEVTSAPSFDVRGVFARNTAWNYASVAVGFAVNLLLFRYVVLRIGDTSAGIWLLLTSLSGYLGLVQLGTVPAVTQLVAVHLERGERLEVNRVASTALALLVGLGLAPMVLIPFLPALVRLLNIPAEVQSDAAFVFLLGLVSFAAQMPGQAFNAFLVAAQRQDRCSQAWMLSLALKLAGAVAILESGFGLVGLVAMELSLVVFMDIVLGALAFRILPGWQVSWQLITGDSVRRLATFGGILLVVRLSAVFIEQTDRLVIAVFLPVGMVTYYAAAWKVYSLAYIPTTTLLYALSPIAAALTGRSASDELKALILRMSKYSAAVALPLGGMLGFGAAAVLDLWMGRAFAERAHIAQILLIGFVVTAYNHAGFAALVGMRRVARTAWAYCVPQAALNLVISLLLVKPLGLAGIALGTAIPAIALQPLFMNMMLKEIGITRTTWWTSVLRPTLLPALSFLPAIAASITLDNSSWTMLGVAIACAAAYVVVFCAVSLSPAERAHLAALTRLGGVLHPTT